MLPFSLSFAVLAHFQFTFSDRPYLFAVTEGCSSYMIYAARVMPDLSKHWLLA